MPRLCALTLVVCLGAVRASGQTPAGPPPRTPDGIRQQIEQLAAPDPVARAFAACFLAEMRRDAAPAVAALRRLLADATPIDPVICRRDLEGATSMLALWKSAPGYEAARALAVVGGEGIDALLAAATAADVPTRRHAVRGLTYVRDARTQSVFVTALRDTDPRTRESAARGLGQFRGDAVADALLVALKDPDGAVRQEAARALGRVARRR